MSSKGRREGRPVSGRVGSPGSQDMDTQVCSSRWATCSLIIQNKNGFCSVGSFSVSWKLFSK